MPRNTRASKRKSDEAENTTPVKTVKKTPVSTPQSTTKTRNTPAKSSPATKSKQFPTKRKIEVDSGEESSTSPLQKKRDLRSTKHSPSQNSEPEKKTTPKSTTVRRSKRQSTALNISLTESIDEQLEDKEARVSPQPKRAKEAIPKKNEKSFSKKQTPAKKTPDTCVTGNMSPSPSKNIKSPLINSCVSKKFKIVEKPPLPRQLSKEELYENYLVSLEDKLDKFDLSFSSTKDEDFFKNWPNSEVLNNIKKNPLLNRIWYSIEGEKRPEETSSSNKLSEFNIASYDMSESSSISTCQYITLVKEEINYIDADVFCIQNISQENEKNLVSCLNDKKYTLSQPNHGCIIGYKDSKFTIVETKTILPHETLMKFIDKTSYPTDWKDSLKESIKEPSPLNKCPLIIYIMKHIGSGSLVLLSSQSQLKPSNECVSRPDLNALNVTSIMWSICQVWNELIDNKHEDKAKRNVSNGNEKHISQKICWLFCGSLNACQDSPIYQLIKDGYPNDDTINRLRCVRSVDLKLTKADLKSKEIHKDKQVKKALIDLLWHAFQHPQADVTSCYADVIGREPPFTQIDDISSKKTEAVSKCNHYIWCSRSSLQPKAVLLTPCRALMSGIQEPNLKSFSIPLAAKIEIVP